VQRLTERQRQQQKQQQRDTKAKATTSDVQQQQQKQHVLHAVNKKQKIKTSQNINRSILLILKTRKSELGVNESEKVYVCGDYYINYSALFMTNDWAAMESILYLHYVLSPIYINYPVEMLRPHHPPPPRTFSAHFPQRYQRNCNLLIYNTSHPAKRS